MITVDQFNNGRRQPVLLDDGKPNEIGSTTERAQRRVAAAIYANCTDLDNRQLDEIIAWVNLYRGNRISVKQK